MGGGVVVGFAAVAPLADDFPVPDDNAAHRHIAVEFPVSTVYQCHIPSYPSGHWLFGFASKKYHPIGDLDATRWNRLGIRTRYYNTDLHRGAFALPNYVKELLNR